MMAEHCVLDLEGTLARLAAGDPEPPAKHRVEEGEEHRRMVRMCCSAGESRFPRPTGIADWQPGFGEHCFRCVPWGE
jgi:hypothetical protein